MNFTQIDGDVALLYLVHLNIAKWIAFCIANVENHFENVIHECCSIELLKICIFNHVSCIVDVQVYIYIDHHTPHK